MKLRVLPLLGAVCLAACGDYVPGIHCAQDADCVKGGKCLCIDPKTCNAATDCSTQGKCACINPKACASDTECGTCQVCRGSPGYCEEESATEDVKNECAEGPCATGFCNGNGACDLKSKGTVCRAANGDCDVAETCSGTDARCPEDKLADAGAVCRPAAGPCDIAETCNGTSRDCPANGFQPAGHECASETCVGSTHTPQRTCDGSGTCKTVDLESCGIYACVSTKCKSSCATNADCVSDAVCDEREGLATSAHCQAATKVDCSDGNGGGLAVALGPCKNSATCFLRVSAGTCDEVSIENKDVYISGDAGAIVQGHADDRPAISIAADGGETTKVALVGLTIQGTRGSTNPEGVSCVGSSTASNARVTILHSVVQSNAGSGIDASNASVTVYRSKILGNRGTGLHLMNSSFSLVNNFISGNGIGTSGGYGLLIYADKEGLTNVFKYNTVAMNNGGGMYCSGTNANAIILHSILWNPGKTELGGSGCTIDTATQAGTSNAICPGITASTGFGFVNASATDFHLAPGSPCRGVIECDSAVSTDIDGDPRPGSGLKCSPGADE